ncbi:MAG: tetratricopeptide repeat protein [Flavobacteriales bacterium]|jgi:tetratricopeptide (TPR) repeat protein
MKKSINLIIALATAYGVSAQCPDAVEGTPKSSDVTTAYTKCSLSGGDSNNPIEAAKYIDRAIKHEKSKLKSKTWVYRGDIYYLMASAENNTCGQALTIAKESYLKAKEVDTKGLKEDEIIFGLNAVSTLAYNSGLNAYNGKAYDKASKNFELSATTLADAGKKDSLYMYSLFNAALSFESAGNLDKALEMYEGCAETGYEAKQCYYRIIGAYQNADSLEASLTYIKKGKEMFPEESEFLIQETNYYLRAKEFEKAEENLKMAIEKDPKNAMLHFVLGTAMDQLGNNSGAVEAYKQAIAIDTGYLDAYHNLGASYVNNSVFLKEKINELDFRSDKAEIENLEKESEEALAAALPFLEKALELEPGNVQVMNSLKSIYFAFERMDDYNAMKAKIDGLK